MHACLRNACPVHPRSHNAATRGAPFGRSAKSLALMTARVDTVARVFHPCTSMGRPGATPGRFCRTPHHALGWIVAAHFFQRYETARAFVVLRRWTFE